MSFLKNISSAHSDTELIARYKSSGSLETLGELYQRYMDLVYGVCLKYLKNPEDAKDCVVNIFEELVSKLKKYDVDNFKGWIYQLAKNHCLMKLRKQKVTVNIDLSLVQSEENIHLDGELVHEDSFVRKDSYGGENEENFKQMQYCLEQLAHLQRQAIELFYLKNKCYKEITGITGIELNKVRSYIQNGRRNLKICMEARRQASSE